MEMQKADHQDHWFSRRYGARAAVQQEFYLIEDLQSKQPTYKKSGFAMQSRFH
jgi:hypothetical protein